ncbi:MAG: iron-sulfur cluster assembly protein [Anaerolineaceae bacterium]|nr:MAG: iron-sulfur cluster assembly protein [Anaerolineaceae bacterium]
MSEEAPKLIWEIDSTHPLKADEIRQALRQVMDPELGMSIIELGLVRGVSMDDDQLEVKMILTTPFCPYGPALLESARSKAEEVSGIPTVIELGMEMWEPSMMEDSAAADWRLF